MKTSFCRSVLSLVCVAFAALGGPATVAAAPVTYVSFANNSYLLTPWEGSRVTVLTRSTSLDPMVMSRVVGALDDAWNVYADLTGRVPIPWPATTLNGRST